jgi:hypothetical protein
MPIWQTINSPFFPVDLILVPNTPVTSLLTKIIARREFISFENIAKKEISKLV